MQRLTANTRTIIQSNYALITEDSYVGSQLPGWKNVKIRVVINPAIGANLSQYLIELNETSSIRSETIKTQIFFYVIEGTCTIKVEEKIQELKQGGYVYLPMGQQYEIIGKQANLVAFQKQYERLEGYEIPKVIFGNKNEKALMPYSGDEALLMQYLLPDHFSMDFAVNIFTYRPGGYLPFVESHIMEHGLLFLQGEGIYRLNEDWHHVTKGDVIWIAPYCPQWFTAMGKEDAVYIYCKDINRHAIEQ